MKKLMLVAMLALVAGCFSPATGPVECAKGYRVEWRRDYSGTAYVACVPEQAPIHLRQPR